jgi:hypothetical protein
VTQFWGLEGKEAHRWGLTMAMSIGRWGAAGEGSDHGSKPELERSESGAWVRRSSSMVQLGQGNRRRRPASEMHSRRMKNSVSASSASRRPAAQGILLLGEGPWAYEGSGQTRLVAVDDDQHDSAQLWHGEEQGGARKRRTERSRD